MKIMHDPGARAAAIAVLAAIAAFSAPVAHAQSDPYAVKWSTVDAGGGRSQSGTYTLQGTAGQAETGVQAGGSYSLSCGFWSQPPAIATSVEGDPAPAPVLQLALRAANPLRRYGHIAFDLPAADRVRIHVFNLRGAVVSTLLDTGMGAGQHAMRWTGRDDANRPLAAGVYFLRLEQGVDQVTRKLVFVP